MKKLIIGLLVVAAGAGTYMYFQSKKATKKPVTDHALVIGSWQADTLQAIKDKAFERKNYNFADSNRLILISNDSLIVKDTLEYSWNKNEQLSWKHKADTVSVSFRVISLSKDSLQLQAADSSRILLLKTR